MYTPAKRILKLDEFMPTLEHCMPKLEHFMPKLEDPICKLKGFIPNLKGFRFVFVMGTAFLFTVVAGSERSDNEASDLFAFSESASVQSAFPDYDSLTPDRADVASPRSP